MLPITTLAPTVSPIPTSLKVTDAVGDVRDEAGRKGSKLAYLDITSMAAHTGADSFYPGDHIYLDVWVAATPPAVDPLRETISFSWLLDTNVDGNPDWEVSIQSDDLSESNGYSAWTSSLWSLSDNQVRYGGEVTVDGNHVGIRIDAGRIHGPARVGIAGATESAIWADPVNDPLNVTIRHDNLPDSQWPDGANWLLLTTGYGR